jgi:hypothetical protein
MSDDITTDHDDDLFEDHNERDFDVPLLPVVCLDEKQEQNEHYRGLTAESSHLRFETAYLVIGEPQLEPSEYNPDGGIRHYILMELGTGKIIPGMMHGDRFRRVTSEDTFF